MSVTTSKSILSNMIFYNLIYKCNEFVNSLYHLEQMNMEFHNKKKISKNKSAFYIRAPRAAPVARGVRMYCTHPAHAFHQDC